MFGYCLDNLDGTTPGANAGTNFTAGASGADSTSVSVLSALSYECQRLVIGIGGINSNAGDGQAAADVLIDPAGGTSWTALINDLCCGFTLQPSSAAGGLSCWYHFPIRLPAGATIGLRAKTQHTADITSGRVVMYAYGAPSRPDMIWAGVGVETLGISDSRGTALTSGASGAWGSWTSVGSTSTYLYKSVQLGINGSDATAASAAFHYQVGVGSQRVPGSPTIQKAFSTNEVGGQTGHGLVTCNLAAGSQMQVRGTSSAGSPETTYVAVYGVY